MENKVCQLHKGSKEWDAVINLYAELLNTARVVRSIAGPWANKHEPKFFSMPSSSGNCRFALGFKFDADKLFPEAFIEVVAQENSLAPAYMLGSARGGDEPLGVFGTGVEAIIAVHAGLFMSDVQEKSKRLGTSRTTMSARRSVSGLKTPYRFPWCLTGGAMEARRSAWRRRPAFL